MDTHKLLHGRAVAREANVFSKNGRWLPRVGIATAFLALAALSALPGEWEVYGAPHAEVTPRGTAPLPPGPTSTPTNISATPTAPTPSPIVTISTSPTPVAVSTVQSGNSVQQPVTSQGQAQISPDRGGSITDASAPVNIDVPPQTTTQAAEWRYLLVTLTQAQQTAADQQALVRTNVVFEIALQPPQPVQNPFAVTATYDDKQIAGISPGSLAIYRFDDATQRWQKLDGCTTKPAEHTVVCTSTNTGTFLLAGTAEPAGLTPTIAVPLLLSGGIVMLVITAFWFRRTH